MVLLLPVSDRVLLLLAEFCAKLSLELELLLLSQPPLVVQYFCLRSLHKVVVVLVVLDLLLVLRVLSLSHFRDEIVGRAESPNVKVLSLVETRVSASLRTLVRVTNFCARNLLGRGARNWGVLVLSHVLVKVEFFAAYTAKSI